VHIDVKMNTALRKALHSNTWRQYLMHLVVTVHIVGRVSCSSGQPPWSAAMVSCDQLDVALVCET